MQEQTKHRTIDLRGMFITLLIECIKQDACLVNCQKKRRKKEVHAYGNITLGLLDI